MMKTLHHELIENLPEPAKTAYINRAGMPVDDIAAISVLEYKADANNTIQVRCPTKSCNIWVLPDMLVDVRSAPDDLTGGADWACSACCMDGWYRERRMIDGKTISRADVEEALGAPTRDRRHKYFAETAQDRREMKKKKRGKA